MVERRLRTVMEDHPLLYLYGDPAYWASFGVMAPFSHPRSRHALPDYQKEFNRRLSAARIVVERASGLSPVAAYFAIAILLTNLRTCFRGNRTSQRFVVPPPSVEAYLLLN
jgi:hypothetical protein